MSLPPILVALAQSSRYIEKQSEIKSTAGSKSKTSVSPARGSEVMRADAAPQVSSKISTDQIIQLCDCRSD